MYAMAQTEVEIVAQSRTSEMTPSGLSASQNTEKSSQSDDRSQIAPQIREGNDIQRQHFELDFSIEKSIRYHRRRQAHYDWIHRMYMLAVIVAGSAAFGNAFGSARYFGLATAIIAALDLVYAFSLKAKDHQVLQSRFSELAEELRAVQKPTGESLVPFKRRLLAIERDEGSIYWAVEKSCFNEVVDAWNLKKDGRASFKWYEYLLMNWLRFERVR